MSNRLFITTNAIYLVRFQKFLITRKIKLVQWCTENIRIPPIEVGIPVMKKKNEIKCNYM